MNYEGSFFRRGDPYLLISSLLLVFVGLLMIYSTTFSSSQPSSQLLRQTVSFVIGLGLLIFFARLDYRYLQSFSVAIYGAGILLLATVLVFGRTAGGSVRWFNLGFYQFQPVEFMKLALVIGLAAFLKRYAARMTAARYVIISALLVLAPVALTLQQPDIGSSIVLLAVWFGMLVVSGVRRIHLLGLVAILTIAAVVAWTFVLRDYQKARLQSFIAPTSDPRGRGYNARQAITAVGSGGLFGRGFGRGVVSQLRYLPEWQTDFIFAFLAEELGLVGAGFLLLVIGMWQARIGRVVVRAGNRFGFFLAFGIFLSVGVQTFINIGMNVGLLPITGIPLPLVSYGGSSLTVSLASLGILQSILIHQWVKVA